MNWPVDDIKAVRPAFIWSSGDIGYGQTATVLLANPNGWKMTHGRHGFVLYPWSLLALRAQIIPGDPDHQGDRHDEKTHGDGTAIKNLQIAVRNQECLAQAILDHWAQNKPDQQGWDGEPEFDHQVAQYAHAQHDIDGELAAPGMFKMSARIRLKSSRPVPLKLESGSNILIRPTAQILFSSITATSFK